MRVRRVSLSSITDIEWSVRRRNETRWAEGHRELVLELTLQRYLVRSCPAPLTLPLRECIARIIMKGLLLSMSRVCLLLTYNGSDFPLGIIYDHYWHMNLLLHISFYMMGQSTNTVYFNSYIGLPISVHITNKKQLRSSIALSNTISSKLSLPAVVGDVCYPMFQPEMKQHPPTREGAGTGL